MNKTIFFASLIWLAGVLSRAAFADESSAFSSELVLKQDFSDSRHWPARKTKRSIEFCGGDWCQEVIDNKSRPVEAAWDAVFIMFYFFDANDEFRARRETLATSLLNKHGERCKGNSEIKAACVLGNLQALYGFEYRRIQYDIGYRCSSVFSAKLPHFTGRGECVRIQL